MKLSVYLTNKNYMNILTRDEIEIFDKIRNNNTKIGALWDRITFIKFSNLTKALDCGKDVFLVWKL